jgi:hypothetical protein
MTKQANQTGAGEIRIIERAPLPAMRMVGATTTDAPTALRWTMMLVWFMRTMAVVWIAKGLFAWTIVLGINHAVADFRELPVVAQALIGFFAVADLMAAVGLWLAAPWGGVLWLSTLGAGASMTGIVGVVLDSLLIVIYFALNWLAANERV